MSRWAAIGAIASGLVGAVAGLWIGLVTYAPTAWFAVFELGVPAAIVGGIIGFACGAVACAVRRGTPRRATHDMT
jgi:hypothetical protein